MKKTCNKMKWLLPVLFLLLSAVPSSAQRMMKNQKGLELSYGVSLLKNHSFSDRNFSRNFEAGIHLTDYLSRGNFLYYGFTFSRLSYGYTENYEDVTGIISNPWWDTENQLTVPVDDYMAEAGYFHPLLSSRFRLLSLNLGLTGTMGYENVNNGKKELEGGSYIDSRSHFVGGGNIYLDLGIYLYDSMQLVLKGKSAFVFGSSFSKVRPSLCCGFRIFL